MFNFEVGRVVCWIGELFPFTKHWSESTCGVEWKNKYV